MASGLAASLQTVVEKRRSTGLLRQLTIRQPGQIDFCSNDYIGLSSSELARDVDVEIARVRASNNEPAAHVVGSTGSRLLTGNSAYYEGTEAMLADFHNGEAALLFNSGYDLNFSFFAYVPEAGDIVVYDHLVHASVREGIRAGRASSRPFEHNNVDSLRAVLARASADRTDHELKTGRFPNIIVAVETVYSMDGHCAPLVEICDAAEEVSAAVVADEAHASGVFGQEGRGLAEELGVENRIFCRVYTFGKGLGGHGAVAIGPRVLYDYLVNYARPLIYSTSLPFHSLVAIRCAYAMMRRTACDRQKHLQQLIHIFQERLAKGVPPNRALTSPSPIQGIIFPGNAEVVAAAQHLQRRGLHCLPIRSPTVPKGTERLRIILHSHNSLEDVNRLMDAVDEVLSAEVDARPRL